MIPGVAVARAGDPEALDVRVSDAERDQVVSLLRTHAAAGSLTLDEFSDRAGEVYASKTRRDLDRTLRELPIPAGPPRGDGRRRRRRRDRARRIREATARFVPPNAICIGIWLAAGAHGYFWPGWVLFGTGIAFARHATLTCVSGDVGSQRPTVPDLSAPADPTLLAPPSTNPATNRPNTPAPADAQGVRVVTTALFVDIVGSTERAAELGDARWRNLLDQHEAIIDAELAAAGGQEFFTRGDEVVAGFDAPAQAVACARSIRAGARTLDLEVRIGLHVGEVHRRGTDVSGIALHIGQRVAGLAAPGEILVSSTVKDMVAGAGIDFEDRGVFELKGVPGAWNLFAVAD